MMSAIEPFICTSVEPRKSVIRSITGVSDRAEDSASKRTKVELLTDDAAPEIAVITINVGASGTLHVWDPKEAVVMQRQYHVMGSAVGCFAKTPLQNTFTSMPVRLTPAEAAFLRDCGAARFVGESALVSCPGMSDQIVFLAQREKQFQDQCEIFKEIRQKKVDSNRQEIFAGKAAKMRSEAIANGIDLGDDETLWQMIRADLLSRPIAREGSARIEHPYRSWRMEMRLLKLEEVPFNYPETHEERVYYAAYATLMKAGFWITSGMKYGGDLLLYEGDVHVNHSICIVKICFEEHETPLEEILRIGRVATACHKAVLWASVKKDYTIDFTISKWALMK